MTDITQYPPQSGEADLQPYGAVSQSVFTGQVFTAVYSRRMWKGLFRWRNVTPELRALLSDDSGQYIISMPKAWHSSIDYTGTLADWVLNMADGTYAYSGSESFPVGTLLQVGRFVVRIKKANGNIYTFENYPPPGLPDSTPVHTGNLTLQIQHNNPLSMRTIIENYYLSMAQLEMGWTEVF